MLSEWDRGVHSTIIYYSASSLSCSNKTREVIKRIKTGKEELNLSLFADSISLCLKDTVDPNQKTFRSDEHLQEVVGYKINIQNSVTFIYSSNKLAEKEIRRISHIW